MKRDKEVTKVIFKKKCDRGLKEWHVVAFFPEATVNRGNIMCYVHDGQHGDASYDYYLSCRPASKKEYACLKRELGKSFGYRLKIVSKVTRKDRERAWRLG